MLSWFKGFLGWGATIREGALIRGNKIYVYVTNHIKRNLMGTAKSIDPGQPVQSMQADHSQNFSLLVDFLCIKW